MARGVAAGMAALAIVGAAVWLGRGEGERESAGGRLAPEFTLQDGAGNKRSLSEFRGQVVVLHFWASWCPPCLEEIPEWLAAAKRFEGKPVRWVAVSLDESWADARKMLREKEFPSGVVSLLDTEKSVPEKYGSYQFPETYLIDPQGRIAAKWVGAQDWAGERVNAQIQGYLAGPGK